MKSRLLNNVSKDRASARHAQSRSLTCKSSPVSHLLAPAKIATSLSVTLFTGRTVYFTRMTPSPRRLSPIQIP